MRIERICDGRVAEWFKAAVLKTAVGASPPWVRIPPLPPNHVDFIDVSIIDPAVSMSIPMLQILTAEADFFWRGRFRLTLFSRRAREG